MKTRKDKICFNAIRIIIALESFIIGFIISWVFIEKPMNNVQFQKCEEFAQSYFEQGGTSPIFEKPLPDDYSVTRNGKNSIIVKKGQLRGKVIATKKNDAIILKKDLETEIAFDVSHACGVYILVIVQLAMNLVVIEYNFKQAEEEFGEELEDQFEEELAEA